MTLLTTNPSTADSSPNRWSRDSEVFRDQLRDLIRRHLPPDWRGCGALEEDELERFEDSWRRTLSSERLLAPSWPHEYGGGGLTEAHDRVLDEECVAALMPQVPVIDGMGVHMLGNTLLEWGSPEQKAHFLPRILDGRDRWCQGFSEPDAGSDLANVRTSARLEGSSWVIHGQKTWTSAGQDATWMFVLARTSDEPRKHDGMSLLLVPLDQPGVTISPIRSMDGALEFNEVFFDGARCNGSDVVGPTGSGWRVAMSLLGHERGKNVVRLNSEFRAEFDRLAELASTSGRSKDLVIRQRLANAYTRVALLRLLAGRGAASDVLGDRLSGSVFKLLWSEHHVESTALAVDLLGARALAPEGRPPTTAYRADNPGAPNSSASWVTTFLRARGGVIYAGSSEVQRNIIAESILGLPK